MKIRVCLDCKSQYDADTTKKCPYVDNHIPARRNRISEKRNKLKESKLTFKDRLDKYSEHNGPPDLI